MLSSAPVIVGIKWSTETKNSAVIAIIKVTATSVSQHLCIRRFCPPSSDNTMCVSILKIIKESPVIHPFSTVYAGSSTAHKRNSSCYFRQKPLSVSKNIPSENPLDGLSFAFQTVYIFRVWCLLGPTDRTCPDVGNLPGGCHCLLGGWRTV